MKKRILVVEDEEKLRRVIELQLLSAGFDVDKAAAAEEGLKIVDRADLVLTDLKLPSMDGLRFLALIRRQNAQVPVIVMTAFGSVETAVESMKAGATDFLLKPFSLDHLLQVVQKALEVRALRDENRQLKEELGRRYEFDNIIGRSPAMQEIFATVERVAPSRATVLLAGESGVGKEKPEDHVQPAGRHSAGDEGPRERPQRRHHFQGDAYPQVRQTIADVGGGRSAARRDHRNDGRSDGISDREV